MKMSSQSNERKCSKHDKEIKTVVLLLEAELWKTNSAIQKDSHPGNARIS